MAWVVATSWLIDEMLLPSTLLNDLLHRRAPAETLNCSDPEFHLSALTLLFVVYSCDLVATRFTP